MPSKIENLKKQLASVRQASIEAANKGDYMRIARLTAQAAQINRDIKNEEWMEKTGLDGPAPIDFKP